MNERQNRSRRSARSGFTLIELLLVLVILSVLIVIVAPRFAGRSKQARVTAARVEVSQLEGQIDIFEIDTGRYPTTQEGLSALVEEPSDVTDWHGPYIKRGLPKDPWGKEYVYKCPGQHNTEGYDLYSYGPDGQEGGGDDIDNWTER